MEASLEWSVLSSKTKTSFSRKMPYPTSPQLTLNIINAIASKMIWFGFYRFLIIVPVQSLRCTLRNKTNIPYKNWFCAQKKTAHAKLECKWATAAMFLGIVLELEPKIIFVGGPPNFFG